MRISVQFNGNSKLLREWTNIRRFFMFVNEEKNSLQQRYSQRNNQASLSSILQSTPHSNIAVYVSVNNAAHFLAIIVFTFLLFSRWSSNALTILSRCSFRRTLCSITAKPVCTCTLSIVFKFKHPYKSIGKLVRNHVTKNLLWWKFYSHNGTLTLG